MVVETAGGWKIVVFGAEQQPFRATVIFFADEDRRVMLLPKIQKPQCEFLLYQFK